MADLKGDSRGSGSPQICTIIRYIYVGLNLPIKKIDFFCCDLVLFSL